MESQLKTLSPLLFAMVLALPSTVAAESFYTEEPVKKKNTPTSSRPVITNYKGKLVAVKYRHQSGSLSFNCPQGVVNFTSIEWPHKAKISATFTFAGGSSTILGKLNMESNKFEGSLKEGSYFIIHTKGILKEDTAQGSIWFQIHNYPKYNANGLCVADFTAYPVR